MTCPGFALEHFSGGKGVDGARGAVLKILEPGRQSVCHIVFYLLLCLTIFHNYKKERSGCLVLKCSLPTSSGGTTWEKRRQD